MTNEPLFLACWPSDPATPATEYCPAGTTLSAQTYTPYSLPSTSDFEVGTFAFTIVICCYLAGSLLGLIFRLFRDSR